MNDQDENSHKSPESVDTTSPNQNHGKKRKIREAHSEADVDASTDCGFEIGGARIGSNDALGQDASPPPVKRSAKAEDDVSGIRDMGYCDASKVSQRDVYSQIEKQQSFPVTLHCILSSEKYASAIVWMPHGRSWKVVDQKRFKNEVLPAFFNHCSTSSFMRQYFLRGLPHVCLLMKSKSHSKPSSTNVLMRGETEVPASMFDSRGSPDFLAISELYPLPDGPIAQSNSNSAASSLVTSTEGYTSTTRGDGKSLEPQQQLQQKRPAEHILPGDNNDKSSPDVSVKVGKRKQSNSSSDELHSFSSSTIPPKSSSSFSTEDDKNGGSNKSTDQSQNRNETTTNTSSLTSKGSEAQLENNNNSQLNQQISLSLNRLPRIPIEGRMINFDGSGIIIPSTGVLFGGYTMNQYLIENQFILSRSLFFHPAVNNGNTTGAMPIRFNPAVAYSFNSVALPGLQGSNSRQGAIGVNQSEVNGTSVSMYGRENRSRNDSGSSSSGNSF